MELYKETSAIDQVHIKVLKIMHMHTSTCMYGY
jgi:hypothetical protein